MSTVKLKVKFNELVVLVNGIQSSITWIPFETEYERKVTTPILQELEEFFLKKLIGKKENYKLQLKEYYARALMVALAWADYKDDTYKKTISDKILGIIDQKLT